MMRKKLFCCLSAFLVACLFCHAESTKPVQVVLLGGQSNMAGRGVYAELDDAVKARIDAVSKRVMVSAQGREKQPLSFYNLGKHAKEFGPELFLGLTLAEKNPDAEYLFIKTAVGGTSLHGAWSPDWSEEKALASEKGEARQKMKLYSDHLKSICENLKMLEDEGKAYEIIGMCWMQGEKDSRLELSAIRYEENLTNLIAAYRKEFNLPKMPFVAGQINNPVRGPKDFKKGPEMVRSAITNVAETVPDTAMIPTVAQAPWTDFPKKDDNVHYNAEGQQRLGIAFAEKLLSFGE